MGHGTFDASAERMRKSHTVKGDGLEFRPKKKSKHPDQVSVSAVPPLELSG